MGRCSISLGTRGLSMCPSTGWQPFIFLMQFTKKTPISKANINKRQPSIYLIDSKGTTGTSIRAVTKGRVTRPGREKERART